MTERLDAALASRGLARSRTHAAALVAGGLVSVDGRPVVKPSVRVAVDARLEVAGADHYVSRAAHKLLAALDGFGIEVDGRTALDMGASTGGFTQVLRERGAAPVIAIDVGHGQLAPEIARDPGVVAIEGMNVRYLTPESLRAASGVDAAPGVVVGDLSFISLVHVLPAVRAVAAPAAEIVLLVKPQFEVGRTAVRGGLVTEPPLRAEAVETVLWAAWDQGLRTRGLLPSPLPGTHGNREYLVRLAAEDGESPTEWMAEIQRMTGDG
ncbi:TlyA family RNA methyltransferase [Microbacterium sp. SORGH_AS_0888]|uniref:TlyA family RNA methyltransferase n=1 Tax=Microbacterium sp. SORGH_AS_0888 TaxID=3041791 RepID=UPI002789FD16|nr:TlyA family RNA methyltransferase [Microbacterium sp. SORGH_AS_0888]MDQ1129025.1 23S rRNA (cytidine1920-2'-O)/16S rRNA (cytidine1409-2'-O)-methyltransferase [Microbacterium sp. SORGH_AS_0888]